MSLDYNLFMCGCTRGNRGRTKTSPLLSCRIDLFYISNTPAKLLTTSTLVPLLIYYESSNKPTITYLSKACIYIRKLFHHKYLRNVTYTSRQFFFVNVTLWTCASTLLTPRKAHTFLVFSLSFPASTRRLTCSQSAFRRENSYKIRGMNFYFALCWSF